MPFTWYNFSIMPHQQIICITPSSEFRLIQIKLNRKWMFKMKKEKNKMTYYLSQEDFFMLPCALLCNLFGASNQSAGNPVIWPIYLTIHPFKHAANQWAYVSASYSFMLGLKAGFESSRQNNKTA